MQVVLGSVRFFRLNAGKLTHGIWLICGRASSMIGQEVALCSFYRPVEAVYVMSPNSALYSLMRSMISSAADPVATVGR